MSSAADPVTGQHTYSYDALNRLVGNQQASGTLTSTTWWNFDAAGEPLTETYTDTAGSAITTTKGFDLAGDVNSLALISGTTLLHSDVYTSTATGDRVQMTDSVSHTALSYGYDQADRLISVTNGLTTELTSYDGDGLRASTSISGTTQGEVWDTAEGLPLLVQDGKVRFVTGPDGQPLEEISGHSIVLYHYQDGLGSTRALLTASGQVATVAGYGPYGRLAYLGGQLYTPLQYAGQLTDAETGLQYLRARYYDPDTMQFLTPDPLVSLTGQPYSYADDNPVNAVAPAGLCDLGPLNLPWGQQGGSCLIQAIQSAEGSAQDFAQAHPDTYAGPLGQAVAGSITSAQTFAQANPGTYSGPVGRVAQAANQALHAPVQPCLNSWVPPVLDAGGEIYAIASLVDGEGELMLFSRGASTGAEDAIQFGPHTEGPLSEGIAATFRGGSYTQRVLQEDTTFYRAYGGKAGPVGSFWSRTPPSGPLQTQLDSALNPAWGNSLEHVAVARVPAGTMVYEGAAASQSITGGGLLMGGGNQVYIPKVNPAWVTP